jgi:hypothetical protein
VTTNPFFTQLSYAPEQNMLASLGAEFIAAYGLDVAYLTRTHVALDQLFMEDPLSAFNDVHYIEMYIKTFMGYGQLSDMMSKFGPMMNDSITFSVSRARFATEFPNIPRPREGDLIYVAMTKSLFEIKFVEHEDSFYQHGNLFYFDIKCERFRYSSEKINTGVLAIDQIQIDNTLEILPQQYIYSEDGFTIETEDGTAITMEQRIDSALTVIPGANNMGVTMTFGIPFTNSSEVITHTQETVTPNPNVQNQYFDEEAQEVIDFSEMNPFGKL